MNLREIAKEQSTNSPNTQLDLIQSELESLKETTQFLINNIQLNMEKFLNQQKEILMTSVKNTFPIISKTLNEQQKHLQKQVNQTIRTEVDNNLSKIKREVSDCTFRLKSSVFANPTAIIFLIFFGVVSTICGGCLLNYSKERSFARLALENEVKNIEKRAVSKYQKKLLDDEYGSGLIELEIQNVRKHKENWSEPDEMIEGLNEKLKKRRQWEKEKRESNK